LVSRCRRADVSHSPIARAVAARFHPEKIILFGAYAYGKPHADSDVDILVVMPARNQRDQAFKIHWAIKPPFPLHLLVRTPKSLQWRLAEAESFLTEVMCRGKVLYEANNHVVATWASEGSAK
jgi:predicted nucleotidyltransferase